MTTIFKQIKETEVIPAIVEDKKVVRVNLNLMKICNLATKSIEAIRKGFDSNDYVYFIVEESEND